MNDGEVHPHSPETLKPSDAAGFMFVDHTTQDRQGHERASTKPADDAAQREEANEERARAHAHYIAEHGNTFLGYQWLLSGLARQPLGGTSGGVQVKVCEGLGFGAGGCPSKDGFEPK